MPPRIDGRGRAKRVQKIASRLAAAHGTAPAEQAEPARLLEAKAFGESKNAMDYEQRIERRVARAEAAATTAAPAPTDPAAYSFEDAPAPAPAEAPRKRAREDAAPAPAKKARTESDEAAAKRAYDSLRRELAASQAALLAFWKDAPRQLGRDLRAVREAAAAAGDAKVVAKVDAFLKAFEEHAASCRAISRDLANPRLKEGETAVRALKRLKATLPKYCGQLADRRAKAEPAVEAMRNKWAPPSLKDADLGWVDALTEAEGADVVATLARRLGSCLAAVDVDSAGRFVVCAPADSFSAFVTLDGAKARVTCVRSDEPGPMSEHTFWRDVSEAVNKDAGALVAGALAKGGGAATLAGRVALLLQATCAARDARSSSAASMWRDFVATGGSVPIPVAFREHPLREAMGVRPL